MTPFRPLPRSQFQPSTPMSPKDCVPATTARLINRATVDAKNPSHADVRHASTNHTGSMSYSQAVAAAAKFGVTLVARSGLSRAQVADIAPSGRMFGIIINCAVTRYTPRRTNSYTGFHSVIVYSGPTLAFGPGGELCGCEKRTAIRHDEYLVEDPGTTSVGWLLWSADLLYRAAETGIGGGIYVLVSPDTEGVQRIAVEAGKLRKTASVSAPSTRNIVVGKAYNIDETATGGPWQRADNTPGIGWLKTTAGDWMPGKKVR